MRTDDECYTGTGPAAEVVGSFWSTLPRATSALHSKSEEGQPTYSELLAQRDELRAELERADTAEALLRQALDALELRCGTNADECKELIPALRERLGMKE